MQNCIHIYIPRVLNNINKTSLITTFKRLNIGDVGYVELHSRVNENGNAYKFAFADIELFDTQEANEFAKNVQSTLVTIVKYDLVNKNKYWEIKNYVPRNMRDIWTPSICQEEWKAELDLEEEFEMLSREIFLECRRSLAV